eukprot:s296_g43.t1
MTGGPQSLRSFNETPPFSQKPNRGLSAVPERLKRSSMSTIERERRVEFNDGMDELPRALVANYTLEILHSIRLDNDVENLCDVLEGGDPRTAAILRRRYEKKGLMKPFPFEKTLTPPSALGLHSTAAPRPRPEPLPAPKVTQQPIVPVTKSEKVEPSMEKPERKSFERKSFDRKSWADMSTDSEDENLENVVSFASSEEGAVQGTQLSWDPIGAEVSVLSGVDGIRARTARLTPTSEKGTFWLKAPASDDPMGMWEPQPQPSAPVAPGARAMATAPEAMSPTADKGQGMTGFLPCQAVMNAQRLPVLQAVQAVPVQPSLGGSLHPTWCSRPVLVDDEFGD